MKDHPCDVLVLGGGPVGMVISALLKSYNFSVVCLDRQSSDVFLNTAYDGRAIALPWGSLQLFDTLGLKDIFMQLGAPIQDIWITQEGYRPAVHYESGPWGHPMGINLESRHLRSALFNLIQDIFQGSQEICDLKKDGTRWHITTQQETKFRPRLIIGADGRTSWLRHHLGWSAHSYTYTQESIVAVVGHQNPHKGQAFEHFMAEGPLALLPMAGGTRSSLIWTVHPQTAVALKERTVEQFLEVLSTHISPFLGKISLDNTSPDTLLKNSPGVWFHPLKALYASPSYDDGVVLIGDACHTMHPVAGQGFNVGLRDAFTLAQHLKNHRSLGLPWWQNATLQGYHHTRQPDVLSMLGFTHAMVRGFSNDIPLLQKTLSLGLSFVEKCPLLKNILCRKAMGIL